MKSILALLKWTAIVIGALMAYGWFYDQPETKQGLIALYLLGAAAFWHTAKQAREAEERINKRIEHLHNRIDRLDGRLLDGRFTDD